MAIGGICAILVWVVFSSGLTHPYVLGGAGLVALVGMFFFFRGILNLTKQVPAPPHLSIYASLVPFKNRSPFWNLRTFSVVTRAISLSASWVRKA